MNDRNVLFCLVDPRWLRSCQASDAAAWYGSLAAARWTKMDQTVWFRHVQTSGRMNMKDLSTKIYEDHEEFKEEGYELMKEDHFLQWKSCGCPGCGGSKTIQSPKGTCQCFAGCLAVSQFREGALWGSAAHLTRMSWWQKSNAKVWEGRCVSLRHNWSSFSWLLGSGRAQEISSERDEGKSIHWRRTGNWWVHWSNE